MPQSKYDPNKHHRRSIRLKGFDYSQVGAYYVTIVTWHRECLFGEVVNGEMKLNRYGKIVQAEWLELPKRIQFLALGAFVVMPNHCHGMLVFFDELGNAPLGLSNKFFPFSRVPEFPPRGPQPDSLGAMIGQFKSRVTKRLWKFSSLNGTPIWQRNYYEHIIRDEQDLQNKTNYIEANPILWGEDDENPNNIQP